MGKCKNESVEMWISNNIFYGKCKKNTLIDLALAIKIVNERLRLFDGNVYPMIVDISNIRFIDQLAREYFNTEGLINTNEIILVSENHVSNIIGEIFINGDESLEGIKIFPSMEKAENYFIK